jgi:hypothetical protein
MDQREKKVRESWPTWSQVRLALVALPSQYTKIQSTAGTPTMAPGQRYA